MILKHCPDLNFPDCLCSTCRVACDCLQPDRMMLECPILGCPGYKRDEKEIARREAAKRAILDAHCGGSAQNQEE